MNLVTIEHSFPMSDPKYSPLPIEKGQNHICTFVYYEDMADLF